MSSYPPLPPPTPIAIALLGQLPALASTVGDRISTVLQRPLPSLRVSLIGYAGSAATDWEAAPMFQVEVWASDELEAEAIAWDLANTWTSAVQERIGSGVVHGRWISQNPIRLPASDREAEGTNLARFMVTVAFRLTGAPNG